MRHVYFISYVCDGIINRIEANRSKPITSMSDILAVETLIQKKLETEKDVCIMYYQLLRTVEE